MTATIIIVVGTAVVFALWFSPLGKRAGIWGGEG
jgi:hypothetical protein